MENFFRKLSKVFFLSEIFQAFLKPFTAFQKGLKDFRNFHERPSGSNISKEQKDYLKNKVKEKKYWV